MHIDQLESRMRMHSPQQRKTATYGKIAKDWLDGDILAMIAVLAFKCNDDEYFMSTEKMRLACSHRYRNDGNQSWWMYFLNETAPLFKVTKRGFTKFVGNDGKVVQGQFSKVVISDEVMQKSIDVQKRKEAGYLHDE